MMTPCDKLGYKVGDEFEVIKEGGLMKIGDKLRLEDDDGSDCPLFECIGCTDEDGDDQTFAQLCYVKKIMSTPQWVPEVGERVESVEDGYQPIPSPKQCAEDLRDDGFHPQATCVERMMGALEWIAHNACQSSRLECQRRAIAALATEEDRAVEEMVAAATDAPLTPEDTCRALYRAGYRKQPQPAEGMSDPKNWRAGDLVVSKIDRTDITCGNVYRIESILEGGSISITDDAGDYRHRDVDGFTFHSRP